MKNLYTFSNLKWVPTFLISLFTFQVAFGQAFTETFSQTGPDFVTSFSRTYNGVQIDYLFTSDGDGGDFVHNEGGGGNLNIQSGDIIDTNLERVTIRRNDGNPFIFKSIDVDNFGGFNAYHNVTVTGKLGAGVVASQTMIYNNSGTLTFNGSTGITVDLIEITAGNFESVLVDNFSGVIISANTPPTASSFTAANGPYENLTYTFSTGNFGYSDSDGDPLSHILIESLPASGILFLDINDDNAYNSGEGVAINQQIGKADLDGGRFKYVQNGSTNTSFQFEVNDGTVNSSGNYVASLNVSPVPTVTLSLTPTSKSESITTATEIKATLSNTFGAPVTVNLGFSGTATGSGVDYSVSGTSITINPGNTTGTVILSNVPDALYEGNETVIIDINSVTNGVESGTQQVTYTIIDDDPVPTVSLEVVDFWNPISDESGGQAYVRAIINTVAGVNVTVPLTFSGTAIGGGTDYSITGSTIILSPGQTMDSIRVTSQYDGIEEGNETVIVTMGTPTNGIKGSPDQVTLTIIDEDAEAPTGYGVVINQDPITPSNSSNVSFTISNAEIGATYNYLFTSSTGGSTVSGSGTISSTTQTISNIDLSGMNDGTITLSVDLTDIYNNTGASVEVTAIKLASDPPFMTGLPTDITVNEGVPSNIDLSGTTFGDPDAAVDDVLDISYLALGGTLSFNPGVGITINQTVPGSWTTSGTISNLNAYLSDPASIKFKSNSGVIGDNAGSIGLTGSDGLVGGSLGTINIDVQPAPYIGYISVPSNGTYKAGMNLDFLVNFSEAVTISGSPNLTLVIGGNIRAASYVSGSGSTSLFFRYTVATGDLDTDGVELTEVYLNGGTIQNSSGINANLTLNNVGSTSGVLVDAVAPFGYNVAFDLLGESLINPINVTIIEFSGTGLEVGSTLHYSFTSSGGGTPVTGTESVFTTAQTFDNGGAGYDLSGLADGTITLTIYLVDAAGNQGTNISDTETKDTGAPSGYSVAWNDALINAVEASNTSFTVSNAEVGATIYYSITSAGFGVVVPVTGSIAVVNPSQVVNVDVSSLIDGVLTVEVYLQDAGGNTGATTSDNSAVLDQTIPLSSIPDLTPASDTGFSDSDNITSDNTPVFTGTSEPFTTLTIYADATELGSTTPSGRGDWTFTPSTAIADGTYDITAIVTDVAGNIGAASGALTVTIDMMAPNAPDPIGVTEDTGLSNTDYITSDNTLIFYGTSEPNSIVTISVTGSTGPFTTTTDGSGNWLYDNTANSLSEGLHELYAYSTDVAGNVGPASYVLDVIIDTQTPPIPSVPDLAPGSDSGVSDSDNLTNDRTPTVQGTAEPNSTIVLFSSEWGEVEVPVDASGNWTYTYGTDFPSGPTFFRAKAVDLAGNESTNSDPLNILIDFIAPVAVVDDPIIQLDANGQASLNPSDIILNLLDNYSSEANISLVLTQDSFDCSDVGAGLIYLNATDEAGNTSSWLSSIIVRDEVKPTIQAKSSIKLNVDAFGTVDLTVGMIDEGSTDACGIQSQVLEKTQFDRTDEGSNTVKYTVTDVNGNSSEVNIEVIIVVVPKVLTVTVDPGQSKIYGDLDPAFTYQASGFEPGDDVGIMTGALSRDPGSDVGTYAITLGTLDAGPNYSINLISADFEITPATLNVTAINNSKVYGDADPNFVFVASGLKNGDPGSTITGALGRAAGEDVGIYAINQGTLDAGPNYTINFTPANFEISQATLDITTNLGQFKVYGDSDPVFTFQYLGLKNGDTDVVITGALARSAGENVAMYPINVGTLDAGPNYTITFTGANFEITPATLTVTANAGQSKVYGDADPSFTYQYSGLKNGDTDVVITGDLQRTPGEDIGMYPINQGTLDAGSNYTINYTGADFTIGEKILTVTVNAGQSKIYGDPDPEFTFVADGFEGGDDIGVLTGALSRVNGEDVGSYAITLGTLDAGPNYTINFIGADFEINQATLDITADAGQSKVYGDPDPTFTYQYTGLKNGDTNAVITGALARAAGEDVGMYPINVGTLDAGPNYSIHYSGADFEITQATLDITANAGQSKVYGDPDPTFTYQYLGLKNGDTFAVITGSLIRVAGEDVGTYAIQPGTIAAGPNYVINFTSADFAITPATLIVTADAGQTKIYGNADPAFTYQYIGLKNGDTNAVITGALDRAAGEDVGAYAINLGTLDAGPNYTINFTGADFTISPRTLNITANPNQTKVYGSADPAFSYTASNFGNGDNTSILTGALSRVAGEDVGMYPITIGSLDAGMNYTINFTSADFEIAEKVLDVTVDAGQSKVFGTADPILTYQVTGFENGDDASILTGALARVAGENVGSYAINLGTLDAGSNYAINYTGASFMINKAMITGITFADGGFVFDGTEKSLAITGALPTGTSVDYTNNSRTDVGSQTVTATITGSNYNTLELMADLTIIPAEIGAILFPDASFEYDGIEKSLAITGTLPAGTSVAYSNNGRTDVGSQEVTATITGSNYTSLELTADLTITAKDITVTADAGQNKIAGEADPILTYTSTGLVVGDGMDVFSGSLSRAAGEDPGMYAITQGTLSAGDNYTINFIGADFEIIDGDSDGDGVPDQQEEEDGTDPMDPTDFKDTDLDGVPDYVEEEQGTDPADPEDYQDEDGDKVPDYVEVQQGTDPNNPDDAQDTDEDGVPDYIQEKSITELVAQSIQVAWNTPEASLNLPTEAMAITGLGEMVNVPVTWDLTGYDPLISGTTSYEGMISTIPGIFNTYELSAELNIEVLDKPAPTDVTLSENEFIGIPDQYFQEIGFFTVIDPTDDQHTLSLPEGLGDNELFEVIDGILFWSSQEQRAGETQFEVVLQVEDRGGNVIQKTFMITRLRTPLSQLDVVNTFTPNADGVNDTWGVPALRYYRGSRIQVFDRGGKRLFYTEDPDVQWDGTFEGEEMAVGAYYWVIEVEETGEVRRGVLNLLRH